MEKVVYSVQFSVLAVFPVLQDKLGTRGAAGCLQPSE